MRIPRKIITVINSILLLASCSTTSVKQIEFPASANNIKKFKELDPDDPSYVVYASKLINDLVQQTVAALKSKNSGRALKASSIGVNLFPFRSDLVDLKKRSIDRFLETTNKMAKAGSYSCEEIRERVRFLKSLAPDQIVNIKTKNCSLNTVKRFKADDFISMIKLQENQFHQADIKYSKEIERDLDQILKRNSKLPMMDALVHSLNYLSSFKMDITNFQIDPDTEDEDNIILYSNDVDSYLPSTGSQYVDGAYIAATVLTFGIGLILLIGGDDEPNDFCSNLCDTLGIKNTSTTLRCRFRGGSNGKSCTTSKKILKHSGAVFSDSWLPRFIVMKTTGTTTNGKIENHFIVDSDHLGRYRQQGISAARSLFDYFDPSDYQMFGKDNQDTRRYWKRRKRDLLYHNVDNGMPFLGPVSKCRLGEVCLYGMKREVVKKLKNVSVRVDVKNTLHLMGNYWNEYLKITQNNKNGHLTRLQREKLGKAAQNIFLDLEKSLKRPARQGL